ncbi:MAG: hypothetical protein LQ352_003331 [Teloschistes flavicans]|nr:MAG: hypothetical protein LQ352_003331 [Teloschistes flavicans]
MKYGQTLQQRSIPEWENYNVDYNDLKRLIKVRTTRGQGDAVTIPGCENEAKALQSFESEFYAELKDQHQRVDLFVQSKAGEISRRLAHLDKQLGQLQQRDALHPTGKVSVKRLERYSRAEEVAEKAGEEIRSLARFVGAQKLAFVKLLKKYRKWTASSSLESRFRKKVLNKSGTFSTKDFQPLLSQYTSVLAAVRAPFDHDGNIMSAIHEASDGGDSGANGVATSHGSKQRKKVQSGRLGHTTTFSTAAIIQQACQHQSDVDFDTALATLPLGRSGGKASYWVHPDHLVELHVLLLQHTRLRRIVDPRATSPDVNRSRQQSRRSSMNGDGKNILNHGDDDAALVLCDNLAHFASRQGTAPISDAEEPVGKALQGAAVTVRYNTIGEASVAAHMSPSASAESRDSKSFRVAKVKRKAVHQLLNRQQSLGATDKLLREANSEGSEDPRSIRNWLEGHPDIRPLVQLQYKRTRFVGLRNGEAGGMWVTLDRDMLMKSTAENFFETTDGELTSDNPDSSGLSSFPFAVLEVRFEGGLQTDFLGALDKTHLTERIRGFSMEAHAVATLCKPQGMPAPYWLPALDQDLRKIPATVQTNLSRQSSIQTSASLVNGKRMSNSATSNGDRPTSSGFSGPAMVSSATSVPDTPLVAPQKTAKRKRRPLRDGPLRQQIPQSSNQRYWNEYDDGDENSDNEPFAIYIDPNRSSSFPGSNIISKAAASLGSYVKASSTRVKSWFRPSEQVENQTPLLVDEPASPEDDSDFDDSPIDPLMNHGRARRHYSTFHDRYYTDPALRSRELLLTRCCIAFFVASFALLLVAACLDFAGRRKEILEVDIGVITGVVFSLLFAIVGVGCMARKEGRIPIVVRLVVLLASTLVCLGSGILLANVVGA